MKNGEQEEVALVKGGKTLIDMILRRQLGGLTISVKVLPEIEDFFRSLGGEQELIDLRTMGPYWRPLDAEKGPLMAYGLTEALGSYSVDKLGQPLKQINRLSGRLEANLSFLRLKGISDGNGAEFRVAGVYSEEGLSQLTDSILESTRGLYQTYLRPMDWVLQVSAQQIQMPIESRGSL